MFTRLLLYGAPGVGKTALVHAVASEANLCLYQISSADISSAWHGQSEKSALNNTLNINMSYFVIKILFQTNKKVI